MLVASGSPGKKHHVVAADSGEVGSELEGHYENATFGFILARPRGTLASGSEDKTVKLCRDVTVRRDSPAAETFFFELAEESRSAFSSRAGGCEDKATSQGQQESTYCRSGNRVGPLDRSINAPGKREIRLRRHKCCRGESLVSSHTHTHTHQRSSSSSRKGPRCSREEEEERPLSRL